MSEQSATDVVVLIGNPRAGSRTGALAAAVSGAVTAALAAAGRPLSGLRTLELADIVGVSFGPEPAQPSTTVDDPLGIVRRARLLVVATPTYKGSYTGLLKLFLDQYGHRELAGVVALPVAVAAAEAHRQAVGTALRELLTELGATVPVPPLAVLESAVGEPEQLADEWVSTNGPALVEAFATG